MFRQVLNLCSCSDVQEEQMINRNAGLQLNGFAKFKTAVATIIALVATANPSIAGDFQAARLMALKGQDALAIPEYSKWINEHNERDLLYHLALVNRAGCYVNLGQFEQALPDLDRSIALKPTVYAFVNRAAAYLGLKEPTKAIADCDSALALKPGYALVYCNRGIAYSDLGQHDKAIADTSSAIVLNKKDYRAYNCRGYEYLSIGRLDQALKDLDQSIALKPDLANAYVNRGATYMALGQTDKAIVDLDKAISIQPNLADAYATRSRVYNLVGDVGKAIADSERAISINPNTALYYCDRAVSYSALGQFDRAIADCDKAIILKPNNDSAYVIRGEALSRAGNITAALRDFEHAYAQNSSDYRFYKARSVAYFKSDDKGRALQDIETALSLARNDVAKKLVLKIRDEFEIGSASTSAVASATTTLLPATRSAVNISDKRGEPLSAEKAPSTHYNPNRPIADKWALVVGISNFKNPEYNLKFAAKDASDFYNYLIKEGNFKPDHVLVLLNEAATKENILTAFGDKFLPSVAEPDDLVVVFVSTHGTPKSTDLGGRNYIVAYDTDISKPYATGVNMDELYARIKEAVKTDRALIIMDACYSGSGIPGAAKGLARSANFDAKEIAQGSGHLVITSSSPTERSWESTVTPNGIFTKYFIESLRSDANKIDVKKAFTQAQEKVEWEVKSAYNATQTPQLGGDWEGRELILSLPATRPRQNFNPELLDLMKAGSTAANNALKINNASR